jgi:cardiolipin synthase
MLGVSVEPETPESSGAREGACWRPPIRAVTNPDPNAIATNPPASIELLRDGAETFPAWLEAMRSARREILVEMYWFDSDRAGRTFADVLAERARAGLEVFIIYDAVGSLGADRDMFAALEEAGAAVHEYNPIAPWRRAFRFGRVLKRDHRKMIVVDGEIGFVGGINMCDAAAPVSEGGKGWRDDCARIRGEAVLELRRLFFDHWLRKGGRAPNAALVAAPRARRAIVAAAAAHDGSVRALAHPAFYPRRARRRPDRIAVAPIQILGHPVRRARRNIRRLYLWNVRSARRAVLIQNAYFVPDPRVRRALQAAARRGVEVRILLPRESDVAAVGRAAQAVYGPLLRAGAHIHEWTRGMMHAKTALVDGWATTGSFNLDRRSLRYNLEVNVASTQPDFVRAVEASIRRDLAASEEIQPERWARRSWWSRLVSWWFYLFRRWL